MITGSTVVSFSEARERLARQRLNESSQKPAWGDNILTLAAYARLVRAEHAAESARIDFERRRDNIREPWWAGPDDIKARVAENNRNWDRYIGLLKHLARLPAKTRSEAQVKRMTIGKKCLAADESTVKMFGQLRDGCLADDHLFPPSMKLARGPRRKEAPAQ